MPAVIQANDIAINSSSIVIAVEVDLTTLSGLLLSIYNKIN